MAIATNPVVQQKPLGVEQFIAQYGGDNRYELIDGEVFDVEPMGWYEQVAGLITAKICVEIESRR